MFTSREHRLLLRRDNADKRLMKYGLQLGVLSREDYARMEEKYSRVDDLAKDLCYEFKTFSCFDRAFFAVKGN